MNLSIFSANSTNIFPIVNSTSGGQLLTEWNLRSRESVATSSNIQYWVGPSYTHSPSDLCVTYQNDSTGTRIGDTGVTIQPGRALVNGHYVESLVPITIDLVVLNQQLQSEGNAQLTGELSIGLVAMYSTSATMAGSLKAENDDAFYEGIQLVILPSSEFVTPIDSPTDETQINAHLKLANFRFTNGRVSDLKLNDDRYKVLSADKISDVEKLVDSEYISKKDLNPDKLYTFAGYGSESGRDTWCDSVDSLMIWDKNPELVPGAVDGASTAGFHYYDGVTYLLIPHKQPDNMTTSSGGPKHYVDKLLPIPAASFESINSGGVLTPEYNKAIHDLKNQVDDFYSLTSGKLRACIDLLESRNPKDTEVDARNRLPEISYLTWEIGDYVLVIQDDTIEVEDAETRGPSTMYVVLPGYVQSLDYETQSPYMLTREELDELGLSTMLDYIDNHEEGRPVDFDYTDYINVSDYRGVAGKDFFVFSFASNMQLLATQPSDWAQNYASYYQYSDITQEYTSVVGEDYTTPVQITEEPSDWSTNWNTYYRKTPTGTTYTQNTQPNWSLATFGHNIYRIDSTVEAPYFYNFNLLPSRTPKPADWDTTYMNYYVINQQGRFVHNAQQDWSTALHDGLYTATPKTCYYKKLSDDAEVVYLYYKVSNSTKLTYSEPVWLTGEIHLATEEVVGGFLNVPETQVGGGYIYRDTTGHLRLLDYAYLASGVLAYQLGQDYATSTGLALTETQAELTEYVNNRVAFANENHSKTTNPDVITVTINITPSDGDAGATLNIMNIDSRFNTSVCVTLLGECNNYTLNFINCEKLRIVNQLTGTYTLNVHRCNLYYDPEILNGLSSISEMSLWYERYSNSDMDIYVKDMTVETNAPISLTADKYWTGESPNDNHYMYALKSITFADNGTITGCKLLVGDNITGNNELGKFASVFPFSLPQTDGLQYPENRLPIGQPLKVTGEFISCYKNNVAESNYTFINTQFTAVSQYSYRVFNPSDNSETIEEHPGQIAFISDIYQLAEIDGFTGMSVDAWLPGKLNQFSGGTCE